MKKLMLSALFALALGTLSAQMENIRIGFQISPSISWMSTNDNGIRKTGSNFGLRGIVDGEYHFVEHVAATAGLGLAFGQGGTLQYDTGGNFFPKSELSDDQYNTGQKPLPDGTKVKYKLQYLEVPLGMKFRTNEKGYFRYFLHAPVFTLGFNLQGRGNISAGEVQLDRENITGDTRFFNFSIGGGAGVEYSLTEDISAVFGLYYNAGLSDITGNNGYTAVENVNDNPFDPNDDYITQPEDAKARLRSFTLRLSILF